MEIEMHYLPKTQMMTIEEFADKHNLVMEVHEKRDLGHRFYARFKHAEIKEDKDSAFLVSESGYGDTPEEAIQNYAEKISSTLLVLNACSEQRREIQVPVLT